MTVPTRTGVEGPPALHGERWTMSPDYMVRIAGLPLEALDGLRCPGSSAWAEAVLDAERSLESLAPRLADQLAEVVREVGEPSARRALLRLRRDVHNLRRPADPSAGLDLVTRVAPAVRPHLERWLTAQARLEDVRSRGDTVLGPELDRARSHLRRLVALPRMRNGLLLASPALEAQIDDYLAPGATLTAKRARKVERSVAGYVYRAAGKPSPFSTFTGVAVGRDAEDRESLAAGTAPAAWTSRVRISVVALSRLADAVLADPARRSDLPVVPASGWVRDAGRVRYVRRSLRAGDAAATVTLDAARDQLFFLRDSEILEDMLALVSRVPAPPHREVAAWLADRLGAGPEECVHYLDALLDLGLLKVPLLATPVHTRDPLAAFRTALTGLGAPWADALAEALEGPARCLEAYPAADPGRRRRLLADLRHGLAAAMEALGARTASLPSTLVYEDATGGANPLFGDAVGWRPLVEQPLRALERMLPAFDQTLRHRRTLHAFFLARFGAGGRCDDLLSLVHDFHEDIYEEYQGYKARNPAVDDEGRLAADPNWLADPTIDALDAARRSFADGIGRLVAAQPDAVDVELGQDLLDELASDTAAVGAGPTAVTHFLQRGHDVVVHNSAFGGFAFPFSRFTHWLDDGLVSRLVERGRTLAPDGAVLAEVTGGFATSNLNLHTPLTDYEIVCPGEVGSASEEHRIPLGDLTLEHDVDEDRLVLRSRRIGREVVPVYLGYLVPHALPAISRTLVLLSPSATYWLDPWAGAPLPPPRDGVQHRPRLRLGRLVLSRRSWSVRTGDLLARVEPDGASLRGAEAGEAERFLAWQRWRHHHGIPGRVFARVRSPRGAAPAGPRPKPQLVDFGSALSLATFRAALTEPGATVELTEMLPDLADRHVRSAEGSHVAELAVETLSRRQPAARAATVPTRERARP